MKKRIILFTICIMVLTIVLYKPIISNAVELETKLEIIQNTSETKYLENDQGFIEKKIIESNSDTGEVTIELKLHNQKKEIVNRKDTEIFIVFDNSTSMEENVASGITRRQAIIDSAKKLVTKTMDKSSNVKIGIVKFSSQYEGIFNEKQYSQSNAATLLGELSDSKENILNKIEAFENSDTEAGTNIYSGLKLASENFTDKDNNKLIILLTDGFPTEFEETYDDDLNVKQTAINKTKDYLKNMNPDITLVSLLSGTTLNSDVISLFGTEANPTNGKFYNITDDNIDKVITEQISEDIGEKIQNPITSTKIVDYFPKEIIDNFGFSCVENPNIGTATESINLESRTITWDIGTLRGNEIATLQYKLKIKDMKNTSLLNKIISTNEKVVLTYKDEENTSYTVELVSSPKIRLSDGKNESSNEGGNNIHSNPSNTKGKTDPTLATTILPNAGLGIALTATIIGVVVIAVYAYGKHRKLKDI